MRQRRSYYWIVARGEDGKPYLLTGGATEDEARQKGMEMLGGLDFEVRRLPTTDMRKASSMIKGNRLEQTRSLKEASRRIGHERSLKRRKRRSRWDDHLAPDGNPRGDMGTLI